MPKKEKLENLGLVVVSAIIIFFIFTPSTTMDNSYRSGVLSLAFDDGLESQYSVAYPLMSTYGFKGTVYMIANWSGLFEGRQLMSFAQAKEMQDSGWEIGSHGLTHTNLTTLSLQEMEYELKMSKQLLESNGFRVTSLAFPYSKYNDEVLNAVKRYYNSSRPSLWGYNNLSETNPFLLKSMWIEKTTRPQDVCSWIAQAEEKNLWLVLTFHDVVQFPEKQYDMSAENFRQVLGCIEKSGITVRTISEETKGISV